MTPAEACTRIGPMDGRVTSVAVSTEASDAAAIPYLPPPGSGYLTFQAIDADVNVVFGTSASMNAPTVSTNSLRIREGEKEDWVPPPGATHYRHIGSGAGFLLIAPSS